MTMLQRIVRIVTTHSHLNPNFEHYYSQLLNASVGDSGMPSAREAQRDLDAVLRQHIAYSSFR